MKIQYNMTQEEKAKAYDEALEKAEGVIRYYKERNRDEAAIEDLEYIFPVLKESSDDERIRKELLRFHASTIDIDGIQGKEILAWLEKQGEQKVPVNDFKAKDWYVSKVDGKIRNIYHSVDKVESKFKAGDWIVNDNSGYVYQVTEIRDDEYCLWPLDTEIEGYVRIIDVDNDYHLWSIQDAKDGDVLSNGKMTVIFKHFEDPSYRQHIVAYIGLDNNGNIQITDDTWNLGIDKATPATKEQRDLLFQKIKDAGYEWDEAKKELKKIAIHKWENGDIVRLKKDNGTRWQIGKSNDPNFLDEWFISEIRESGIAGGYVSTYILDNDYEFVNNPINDAQKEIDKKFDKLRKTASKDCSNVGNRVEWIKSIKERLGGKELKGE